MSSYTKVKIEGLDFSGRRQIEDRQEFVPVASQHDSLVLNPESRDNEMNLRACRQSHLRLVVDNGGINPFVSPKSRRIFNAKYRLLSTPVLAPLDISASSFAGFLEERYRAEYTQNKAGLEVVVFVERRPNQAVLAETIELMRARGFAVAWLERPCGGASFSLVLRWA